MCFGQKHNRLNLKSYIIKETVYIKVKNNNNNKYLLSDYYMLDTVPSILYTLSHLILQQSHGDSYCSYAHFIVGELEKLWNNLPR